MLTPSDLPWISLTALGNCASSLPKLEYKIFWGKNVRYLPHLCTHHILSRWHMTLPFAMGKRPPAPCLPTVTSAVRVFLSRAFLLRGANELMRYISLWEKMTNQGSEYVERNVHKHKVYVQVNCLLVQKPDPLHQLCSTCWVWGCFSPLLISAALYTGRERIYSGATHFFFFLLNIKQPGRKKQNWGHSSDQRSKPQKTYAK